MKKLNFIVIPLMVVSFLASCNNSTDVCVVTFNSNGGSFVETQKIKKGGTVHEPENPIRDKYDFTGWCLDGSTFEFSTKITKDITLVANWDKIPEPGVTHTISFSGSDCRAGKTTDDLKEIFQINCEEGEINLIVSPNDSFALTNEISFLVDGVRVAPKSYTQEGSNYKLIFNLSGETLIYVNALPVSTSHKVTFSGDDYCSMFYGTQSVTSTGIEISVPDIDPYYVKFTIKANDSTYMKPGTVTLSNLDMYSFNKDTGELFINLKSQVNVSALCDAYKSLEECSWAQISEISELGKAYEAFKIGDTKTVKVNELDHTVRIIGFSHDELSTSTTEKPKYAGITFEFANVITDSNGNAITTIWDGIEKESGNNFDYRNSVLHKRLNVDDDCIFDELPEDLKEEGIIKTVKKIVGVSTDDGDSYTATAFATNKCPKLFPLAHDEITKDRHENFVTSGEGSTYEYYKYHDDNNSRIKKAVNGSAQLYWLRSPDISLGANFEAWDIDTRGYLSLDGDIYNYAYAVAPAFCI